MVAGAGKAFRLEGTGSKPTLGNPVAAAQVLSLANFTGVEIYEPEELILEAGAGTKLSDIEKLLKKRGQMLAFEPPDFSSLLGTTSSGSIGGLVAVGLSGPRRIKAGAVRDHVLGLRGVSGAGEIIRAGARVVKNVTGYDLPKLVTGSHGSLLAVTSVTLKVLPRPETEETIMIPYLADQEAVALMSLAMQSAADVSGAAHVPGEGTYLRLEGIAPSVAFRRARLLTLCGKHAAVLAEKDSTKQWQAIRDVKPLWKHRSHAIWRLSVTPSDGPAVAERISSSLDARYFFDWAGGLIWLAVAGEKDGGAAVIRKSYPSGHATLMRAAPSIRNQVPAFEPQAPALAALSRRVKAAFDPRNLLNPGIMART